MNRRAFLPLANATSIPLTISERMAGRLQFLQLLESRAAKYVMFDCQAVPPALGGAGRGRSNG
jgi:L-alanine-DL-glutamate epimerase-like enolase superfamily enzyme